MVEKESKTSCQVFHISPEDQRMEAIVSAMRQDGCCILRGLLDAESTKRLEAVANRLLERPMIAGVPGYSKVDYPKKLFDPFRLGPEFLRLCVNDLLVGVIEELMESECVLAECFGKLDRGVNYVYFPLHCDFAEGWKKSPDSDFRISQEDMKNVLGVGAVLYLRDATEGAFTYCPGSHLLGAPHGQKLSSYPSDQKTSIVSSKVRCEGRAGDLVIFDDRGFHGPDQPSASDRLVVLLDYYRVSTFGFKQVTPIQVPTKDLGGLTARQMRVLGAGAGVMVDQQEYTGARFRHTWQYRLSSILVASAFYSKHLKSVLKRAIGK